MGDLLVTGMQVLYSDTGTALPDETSISFGTYGAWTSWTSVGGISGPVRISNEKDYYFYEKQQYTDPTNVFTVGRRRRILFEADDLTGPLLALLLDGANADTAAGPSQKAFSKITIGSEPGEATVKQWGFEGFRTDSNGVRQPVRLFIYKAVLLTPGDIVFNKRSQAQVPCALVPIADTSQSSDEEIGEMHIVTSGPGS